MLQGDDLAAFLSKCWRKQAAFYPQAISVSSYPVSTDSLCALTESELVESRLINAELSVAHGPFDFEASPGQPLLGEREMLMVQCLEQHLPVISRLIDEAFSFLPRWQIDDVMASLGYDGANCGAHFDHYDVFLLQVSGCKTWHLDDSQHIDDELDPAADLRLLRQFNATQTFTARPGDVIYIPPGTGHHGICEGESLTLSVGIRNPTTAELLADVSEFALERAEALPLETALHTAGQGLNAGISDSLAKTVNDIFTPELLGHWYGCYVTRLRDVDLLEPQAAPLELPGQTIKATLPSRLTWEQRDQLTLFANGDWFEMTQADLPWVRQLCESRKVRLPSNLSSNTILVLQTLFEAGALTVAP